MTHEPLDQFPDLPESDETVANPQETDAPRPPDGTWLWPFEAFGIMALLCATIAALNGAFDRPHRGATISAQQEQAERMMLIEQAIEVDNSTEPGAQHVRLDE